MPTTLEELPDWGRKAVVDFLFTESANDTIPHIMANKEDAAKFISLLRRAFIAGWNARTSQIRAVPKLRDFPPNKPSKRKQVAGHKEGNPLLPGPFGKSR